jgi:D-threonate/D-erythronate kinase
LSFSRGAPAVVSAYTGHLARGADVICCDAVTENDLEVLQAAATELGPRVLVVGSAGLTRVAARAHQADHLAGPTPSRLAGPVLTVLGSYSELARKQRTAITASGEVDVVMVMAPFGPDEQRRAADELAASTGDVLLIPDPTAPVRREQANEVAAALATAAGRLLRERHGELAGLVLTGGETGRAVLLTLGVHSFIVLGELDPGVVLSCVPTLGDLPLVTKAGAFGEPATLERARRALHNRTVERTTVH